jgi:rod shape-determining protein MreD
MRYLQWAFIILLTFILQRRLSLFGVAPNLTFVLVYYAGIREGGFSGIILGSLVGSIEDSLSGAFFGPHFLSKGLVGYFSSFMSGSFFRWTPILGAIGIAALTIIDSAVVFASRSFFDSIPVSIGAAVLIIAIQTLFNAPLGILVRPKNTD